METPFIYGGIATGDNFTDREEATQHLVTNFKSLINTIILSPRRWGKSSLVYKASQIATQERKDLRVCLIDLLNVRNEEHFYELFSQKVIAATASKWDEVILMAKNIMGSIIPQLNISDGTGTGFTFDFKFDKDSYDIDAILDLSEKIAKKKKIKIMVCIDEFQRILDLKDGDYIMNRLRSHWQYHQNVSYCLYGSKRHSMENIFNSTQSPFYRFGDFIFLDKIPREYWIPFIIGRFKDTGKHIEQQEADLIARLVEDHPYYCQQLSQLSWLRTDKICSEEIILKSHEALTAQLSLLYINMTENFTNSQISLMQALINEEENMTSLATLAKYNFKSTNAVYRSIETLLKADVLDKIGKMINFQDPIYKYWLKTKYFKN